MPLPLRILDHIAVAMWHKRLATTARAAEADGRATPLDGGRCPIANGPRLAAHARVAGGSAEWQESLERINDIVARMEAGKIDGRIVVAMP